MPQLNAASRLEQPRQEVETLPAEQLRRAVEALPENQLRSALAQIPGHQLRETLRQIEWPAKTSEAQVNSVGSDWLKNSGLANSDVLAGLIKRPPTKTGG